MRLLEEENTKLKGEVADMKRRLEELEGKMRERESAAIQSGGSGLANQPSIAMNISPPGTPTKERRTVREGHKDASREDFKAMTPQEEEAATRENALIERVMQMMTARLATIEERLPPERSFRSQIGFGSSKAKKGNKAPKTHSEALAPAPVNKREEGKKAKPQQGQQTQPSTASTSAFRPQGNRGKVDGKKEVSVIAPKAKTKVKTMEIVATGKAPQVATTPSKSEWIEVVKGKGKRGGTNATKQKVAPTSHAKTRRGINPKTTETRGTDDKGHSKSQPPTAQKKKKKVSPPKRAAIVLSMPPQADNNAMEITNEKGVASNKLADAVAGVREEIKLADHNIPALKPKRTATGGILYEVLGKDSRKNAESLADALKKKLESKGIRVTVPVKKADMCELPGWTTPLQWRMLRKQSQQ